MFELIVMSGMGLLFLIAGLLILKKRFLRLLHDPHSPDRKWGRQERSEKGTGLALVIISIGIFLISIAHYLSLTSYGWIGFGVFFIGGFLLILRTIKSINVGLH